MPTNAFHYVFPDMEVQVHRQFLVSGLLVGTHIWPVKETSLWQVSMFEEVVFRGMSSSTPFSGSNNVNFHHHQLCQNRPSISSQVKPWLPFEKLYFRQLGSVEVRDTLHEIR